MVTFEADFDAGGIVRGSKDAFQALNRMSHAMQIVGDQLTLLGIAGGGTMGKFSAALARAQPWIMAITLGMTALNSVLQISNRRAREAADEWDRLGKSMEKAQLDEKAARFLNLSPTSAMKARLDVLYQGVSASMRGETGTVEAMRMATGTSIRDVAQFLAGQGHAQARQFLDRGEFSLRPGDPGYRRPGRVDFPNISADFGALGMSGSQQQEFLSRQYHGLSATIAGNEYMSRWDQFGQTTYDPRTGAIKHAGVGDYLNYDEMGRTFAGGGPGGGFTYEQIGMGANERAARKEMELQAMYELEQSAQRVGMYLADASLRFISGLSSARDIMAEIFMMAARSGLEQGFSSLYKGLGGALGLTASQAGASTVTGSIPGGGTGIPSNSVPGGG